MKKTTFPTLVLLVAALGLPEFLFSQNVGISTDGSAPESGVMLDVKGTSPVATTAVLQNIFQIRSYDATASALKLRLGLKTDAAVGLRYGLIDVYDAGAATYRNLAVQPLGGNVGIGTTAPNRKLEILSGNSDGITFGQQADNTQTIQSFIDGQWTNRTTYAGGCCNALLLQPDVGVVGIGTAAPAYKLHTAGDIFADGGWFRVSGNQGLYFESWGGGWYMADATWVRAYNSKNVWVDAILGTNGGLTSGYSGAAPPAGGAIIAGNVGINQPAPAAKLDIVGTSGATIKIVDGNQGAGKVLTSDGSGNGSWQPMSGGGGCAPSSQVFSANGTFSVTAGTFVMVSMCGAGGGGGGGGGGGTTQNSGAGGGGGAESFFYYPVAVTNTEVWTITVGAAGAAGALNTNGGAGGSSSIVGSISGAIIAASGGAGGARGWPTNANTFVPGGDGGSGGGAGAGAGGTGGQSCGGVCVVEPIVGGSIIPGCNYSPGAGGGGGEYCNNYGNFGAAGGNVVPKLGGIANNFYYGGGGGGACLYGTGGNGAGSNNAGYVATAGSGNGAGGGGGCGSGPLNYGGVSKVGAAGSAGKVTIYFWQ